MYTKIYMDHFSNPQNIGSLPDKDYSCLVINREGGCFDQVELYVKFESNIIQDIKYRLKACSGTIMSFSLFTSLVKGKSISEIRELSFDNLLTQLGDLPEKKHHSLRLALEARDKLVEYWEHSKLNLK